MAYCSPSKSVLANRRSALQARAQVEATRTVVAASPALIAARIAAAPVRRSA